MEYCWLERESKEGTRVNRHTWVPINLCRDEQGFSHYVEAEDPDILVLTELKVVNNSSFDLSDCSELAPIA